MASNEWLDLVNKDNGNIDDNFKPESWMCDNYSWLKDLKLSQIIVPASHDAATGVLQSLTKLARAGSVQTQFHTIRRQLELGIRLFDLRTCLRTC